MVSRVLLCGLFRATAGQMGALSRIIWLDTMGESDREEGDMGGAVEGRATADQVCHPGGV